jgi:hypothetical protein
MLGCVVAAALAVVVRGSPLASTPDDPGFAPLNDLLRNVTFQLPPLSFSKDGLDATLENTLCGHIHIGLLEVGFTPPSSGSAAGRGVESAAKPLGDIAFSALGLGLGCSADVKYTAPLGIHGTLGVTFAVKDSGLTAVATFADDHVPETTPSVPTSMALPSAQCVGTFDVTDLKFDGGAVGWILNIFKSEIVSLVENQLGSVACELVSEDIPPLINPLLFNISTLLREAGANPPPPFGTVPLPRQPVVLPASLTRASSAATVDWASNPALTLVDWVVDNVLGDDAALPAATTSAAATRRMALVDPLVEHLTGGSGVFARDGLSIELIHFDDALTNTTIGIRSFSIGGLDTIESLDVLVPYVEGEASANASALTFSTWSRVGMSALNLSLGLWLDLGPGTSIDHGAGTYHLEVEISAGLEDVEAVGILLSALKREALEDISIGSLLRTPVGCALSALWEGDAGLNITGFDLALARLEGPTITGLISGGLDTLVDDSVAAARALYGDAVWAATRGLSDGAGREVANGAIGLVRAFGAALLSCPRAGGGGLPPSPVEWKHSALLALLSSAVSGGDRSAIGVGGWLMDANALLASG